MIFTMLLGLDVVHARGRRHTSKAAIQLQGFGNRKDTEALKKAFQKFIVSIPAAKFPIKIDRSKNLIRQNEYYWGSTEIGSGLLTGRSAMNRSRTIDRKLIARDRFSPLFELLDDEKVISKIIIGRGQGGYTVKKFGLGHAVYRGAMRTTKVAAFAAAVTPPQFP